MQAARTRTSNSRPTAPALSSRRLASATANPRSSASTSSPPPSTSASAALPSQVSPTLAQRRRQAGSGGGTIDSTVALLNPDALARSLPAPPRSTLPRTPALTPTAPQQQRPPGTRTRTSRTSPRHSRSRSSSSSSTTRGDLVRMPPITSPSANSTRSKADSPTSTTTTTPTHLRRSQQQPQQRHETSSRASMEQPTVVPPARLQQLPCTPPSSDAGSMALREGHDEAPRDETADAEAAFFHSHGDGQRRGSDSTASRRDDLLTRRRGSNSSVRLPGMLQPSKLASASCATDTPSVVTSPARMVSQPDMNTLSVTSPARRCFISGGSGEGDATHSTSSGSGADVPSEKRVSSAGQAEPASVSLSSTTTRAIASAQPHRSSNGDHSHEARGNGRRGSGHDKDDAENAAAAPTADPRVRSLVNQLYQHVLDVQPEDPLRYLAHYSSQSRTPAPQPNPEGVTDASNATMVAREEGSGAEPACGADDAEAPAKAGDDDARGGGLSETHVRTCGSSTYPPLSRSTMDQRTAATTTPPPASSSPSTTQQQQQPPPARASPSTSASTTGDAGAAAMVAIVVAARGRSSPVHSRASRQPETGSAPRTEEAGAGLSNNSSNSSAVRGARPLPPPPAPPSAPTPSLVARRISAGSPGNTAQLRGSLGSGSTHAKLSSPFFAPRHTFGGAAAHGVGSASSTHLSAGLTSAQSVRLGAPQPSFTGGLGSTAEQLQQRPEATPSDASSLFSTNSVDVHEFMAEFRAAKEEVCGGGYECPAITLDDLATIMEGVSFPLTDGAALLDLFEELLPCARYLADTETASAAESLAAAMSAAPQSGAPGRGPQGSHGGPVQRRSKDATGDESSVPSRVSSGSLHRDMSGRARAAPPSSAAAAMQAWGGVGGVGGAPVYPVTPLTVGVATVSAFTAAGSHVVAAHRPSSPLTLTAGGNFNSSSKQNGAGGVHCFSGASHSGSNIAATAAAATATAATTTTSAVSEAFSPASIPSPPTTMRLAVNADDSGVPPAVPFETLLARMGFKIQGRYTAEAIRIAFYGMVVDDSDTATADAEAQQLAGEKMKERACTADGEAPSSFTARAAAVAGLRRRESASVSQLSSSVDLTNMARQHHEPGAGAATLPNVFSYDSLAPSEAAGTYSDFATLQNTVTASATGNGTGAALLSGCSVPLRRCIAEGLFARLGLVEVTAGDVQRAIRSAGLPIAPEEQRVCECHLEDFARLVRAVTSVIDRGMSVSPANFCLSSVRDSSLQQQQTQQSLPHSSSMGSWKEEALSASSRIGSAPPVHSIRFMY